MLIKVDSLTASIISFNQDKIVIKVPPGIYNKRVTEVSLLIDSTAVSTQRFTVLDPWLQKAHIPFAGHQGGVGFSIGEYGYRALTVRNVPGSNLELDVSRYSPEENKWTAMAPFPGLLDSRDRNFISSFVLGNSVYLGGGTVSGTDVSDFWRYDAISDTWTQVSDFPYPTARALGLSDGQQGYLVTYDLVSSNQTNFWTYDPNADAWAPMPALTPSPAQEAKADAGFFLAGKFYVYVSNLSGTQSQLYAFDLATSTWARKANLPHTGRTDGAAGLAGNGRGYLVVGEYLYTYTPAQDSWQRLTQLPSPRPDFSHWGISRYEPTVFFIQGKVYVGEETEGWGLITIDLTSTNSTQPTSHSFRVESLS